MNPVVRRQIQSLEQLKWFAGITLRGEIPEAARFYQVQPGTSHIQWLVGHVAATIDGLGLTTFGATPGLADRYGAAFGFGVAPEADPSRYPAWEDLVTDLTGAIDRLIGVLGGLTDGELDEPLPADSPFAKRFKARGEMVPFLCLHTAYHLGQVSLLRRAQGLPSGMSLRA